mgnify:CR=1 FL=1
MAKTVKSQLAAYAYIRSAPRIENDHEAIKRMMLQFLSVQIEKIHKTLFDFPNIRTNQQVLNEAINDVKLMQIKINQLRTVLTEELLPAVTFLIKNANENIDLCDSILAAGFGSVLAGVNKGKIFTHKSADLNLLDRKCYDLAAALDVRIYP